jgi:hypothetical protein
MDESSASYEPQLITRHLKQTGATLCCLSCGGTDIHLADSRYALVELDAENRLTDSATKCGARVCTTCSYVSLYALTVIDPESGALERTVHEA